MTYLPRNQWTNAHVEALSTHIRNIPNAANAISTRLDYIRTQIAAIKDNTCTGVAYWRDDYLYCNHGTNDNCPVHGRHPQGKRLRSYIGNDPAKIAAAKAQISNAQRLQQLRADEKKLITQLHAILDHAKAIARQITA